MPDYREKLLTEIKNELIANDLDTEEITKLEFILIDKLSNYEISNRCTELALPDIASPQLINLYIGSILTEGKSKRTAKMYKRIIERFWADINKPLLEVGTFDIRMWLAKIQSSASLRTAENYRSYLSAFYIWLQKQEFIDKNPMAKIKPVKYEAIVRNYFSEVEVDALRAGCKTLRERAEIELMLSCGARVSEVAAMNINDVDLPNLSIVIKEGKGNKQRKVFITEVARKHIRAYLLSRKDDNIALFITKNNDRISSRAISDDIKRISERAGVKEAHPHKFRRTFASMLVKKGMNVRVIQILMGHSDINTTMMYITLDTNHIKNEYLRCA